MILAHILKIIFTYDDFRISYYTPKYLVKICIYLIYMICLNILITVFDIFGTLWNPNLFYALRNIVSKKASIGFTRLPKVLVVENVKNA